MQVTKTINNNIVACISADGKEQIAMGRGLGFDFKVGSTLDESRIEKIFSIEERNGYDNAKNLFENIPEKLLNLCIGIIDHAKELLDTNLSDSIYLTLTDHINFALSKHREGIDLYSAISGEVKVFYPREYLIGKEAIKLIENEMDVKIASDEACAIALHIVNAEYNTEISSIMRITESIAEVLEIIKRKTGLEIRDDDIAGAAFISFLKFFVFRIFTNNPIADKSTDKFPQAMAGVSTDCMVLSDVIASHLCAGSHNRLSKMDKAILAANIYSLKEYFLRRK